MGNASAGQGEGAAPIILYENLRTLVYTPFYLAAVRGYWADAGLDVDLRLSPALSETAEGLLAGRADVSWGGPMRVMLHHDRDPDCPLVCFGQVVARDPFILVGRVPNPTFRLEELAGLRLAIAHEAPTPWLTLQDDLRRAGLDPAALTLLPEAPMADNVQSLATGAADVIQVFEPYATQIVRAGEGHIWHRFATRGDIGYTTFYTTRPFATASRDTCLRLLAGIAPALTAIRAEPAKTIAAEIAPFFEHLDAETAAEAIAGYAASGLWAARPELPPTAFVRLKAALLSGGLIARDIPYADAVDASLTLPA